MDISSVIKKRMIFFVFSLVFVVFITFTSSYALMNNGYVNSAKVINNGNLQIIYENGELNAKNGSYPMSFQQGNYESPSNIVKIVNKGHFSTKFSVIIKENSKVDNSLEFSKIYYSVNNSEPAILGNQDNNIIYSSDIKSREEYILDIKLWVGSELITNEDQGKQVNLSIDVIPN